MKRKVTTTPKMPYHKYVFDEEKRVFLGKFEEMYKNEDVEHYDSWFQEDLTVLSKQLFLTILNRYNFNKILDLGCGKGTFTHLLKKQNNHVVGVDISKTAIRKANSKYKGIEFRVSDLLEAVSCREGERYDLIVIMELCSYLENWRELIVQCSKITDYMFISLYLPPDPIGFVKSFDDIKNEINKHFVKETEVLLDNSVILNLSKTKR